MSQDGSARSDLPAGGQKELGGVSHSERVMAGLMKMLANLTIQNQQLLQQHLQQQQQTAAVAGDRGVQQQTAGAADNRGLQQQMAAGDGGRVQESGGARERRIIDSRGSLVRETSVKQESLSGEGRQPSLAGSYPGFRVAALAPVEDVLRRDGQREESGTVRGFDPARESATMFGFGQGGFKPTIPVFTGKQESFSRWKQEAVIYSRRYGFDAVFTRANECQDVNVGDPDCPMERLQDEFGVDIVILHLNAWQFLSSALKSEKDRDILFRVNSPGAAWRSSIETYSLKTQGASLALLQKLDSVRIETNDDPPLKLLEMEDTARSLRSSHSQWQHLTELRHRKIRKRSFPRVRYTKAEAGGERRRVLSRGCRILSVEAVRLMRVQAAAPQQAKVRGRSSLRGHWRG